MLWYLLKTWQGREEELVEEIRRTVPPYLYEEAFVIYNERIWRRQGRSILHPEPLFKGYVFMTCRETEPLFRRLEKIPAMSRLIAMGYLSMFPLMEKDARFLERISGSDHVVRLSQMLKEDGSTDGPSGLQESAKIYRVSGPLAGCLSDIDGIEFRKRFAKVYKKLWGEDRTIALGIVLNEDMERGLVCDGQEITAEPSEAYSLLEIEKDSEGKENYREIRRLMVVPGEYKGQEKPMRAIG